MMRGFSLVLLLVRLHGSLATLVFPRFQPPDVSQRLLGDHTTPTEPVRDQQPSTMTEQTDILCDAGKHRHWTGTVSLGPSRDMFFWYFESRSDPVNDPLIIWLNGGPGSSSMQGALYEVGPCVVNQDGETTSRNKHSWINHANLLVVDQPIGVGLSYTPDADLWGQTLQDSAIDFDKFLDGFFKLVPELDGRPIYFTGESFGGKYVPYYAALTRRKFDSIILVNGYVDPAFTSLGLYEHLCKPTPSGEPRFLNKTVCQHMEEGYTACEKSGDLCRITYDPDVCASAITTCVLGIENWWDLKDGDPDRFDDRRRCKLQPEVPPCGGMGMNRVSKFLNLPKVQEALHINFTYEIVNMALNEKWSASPATTVPSSREIARLLDDKGTRVLVLNGNNDVAVTTETTLRVYDDLKWKRHTAFKLKSLQPWTYSDSSTRRVQGGTFKSEDNLALVTVDEAGHANPADQREAVSYVVKKWIDREPLE